jgi:hypothetical protein
MRYKEIITESVYSHNIVLIEKLLYDELTTVFEGRLKSLVMEANATPELFFKEYFWPDTEDDAFRNTSILKYFRNFTNIVWPRVITDQQVIQAFQIKGRVVCGMSDKFKPGEAGYENANGVHNIGFSMSDAKLIELKVREYLFNNLQPIDINTSLNDWFIKSQRVVTAMIKALTEWPKVRMLNNALLHELVHASQSSKRKNGMTSSDTINAFGNKYDDYFDKIKAGIFDKDYYGSYHEIDSYANQIVALLIQKHPNVSDLKTAMSSLSKIEYDNYHNKRDVSKKEAAIHEKIWRRFVKRVVQNIQKYIESRNSQA